MKPSKPSKPSPSFPLFAHASGKWAKKCQGRLRYFGRWEDPQGALREYEQWLGTDNLSVIEPHGLSLKDACNEFYEAKVQAQREGRLSVRTLQDYKRSCEWLLEFFGRDRLVASITPLDFGEYRQRLFERRNVVGVANEITRTRMVFKWCLDTQLITTPIHFGPDFRKPPAKALRKHRREQGKKLFMLLLDECGTHLKAMVYLALNGGLGNADLIQMPLSAVDLQSGWLNYPRPKTEVDRLIPLWPETVEALRLSLSRRYKPKPEFQDRFFIRPNGDDWGSSAKPISKQVRQALQRAGIPRRTFYDLRRTFATVGSGAKDQIAVNAIMGHVDPGVPAMYRQEIDRARLEAVTNHVREWLQGK
jgi:integrase